MAALLAVATIHVSTAVAMLALLIGLPPCEYEDSHWCVWDAQHMGNGQGQSFISLG